MVFVRWVVVLVGAKLISMQHWCEIFHVTSHYADLVILNNKIKNLMNN